MPLPCKAKLASQANTTLRDIDVMLVLKDALGRPSFEENGIQGKRNL